MFTTETVRSEQQTKKEGKRENILSVRGSIRHKSKSDFHKRDFRLDNKSGSSSFALVVTVCVFIASYVFFFFIYMFSSSSCVVFFPVFEHLFNLVSSPPNERRIAFILQKVKE